MVLAGLDTPAREDRLAAFHARHADNPLVIDKWLSLQAGSLHPRVLDHVSALAAHPDFTLHNPNRVRALYMAMAVNPGAFHDASGAGYRTIADLILALDPLNAQTAARFVAPLGRWRRIEPARAALMRSELERIAAAPKLWLRSSVRACWPPSRTASSAGAAECRWAPSPGLTLALAAAMPMRRWPGTGQSRSKRCGRARGWSASTRSIRPIA
jgi:hypothetical protein